MAKDAIGSTKLIKCNRGFRKKRPEHRMRFLQMTFFKFSPQMNFRCEGQFETVIDNT